MRSRPDHPLATAPLRDESGAQRRQHRKAYGVAVNEGWRKGILEQRAFAGSVASIVLSLLSDPVRGRLLNDLVTSMITTSY